MKKHVVVAVLSLFALAVCGIAMAQTPAPAHTSSAAVPAAAPAAAPVAPPAPVPAEKKDAVTHVVGKVSVKTEKVGDADVKVPYIVVAEAKAEDGKLVLDLVGKSLKVTGPKAAEVEKLDGKEVEAKGVVKDEKTIEVQTVAEKKPLEKKADLPAPTKPAEKK